jgi:anti-anti-sigma factor
LSLQIEQRELDARTLLIRAAGRMLLGTGGMEIESITSEGIKRGLRRFVLDFAELTHIDSTGIGHCIASLNMLMQHGGSLGIAGATGQVRDSFRVTQLDRVFPFFDSVEAAQAGLK